MTPIISSRWTVATRSVRLEVLIPTHKVIAPLSAYTMRRPTTTGVQQGRAVARGLATEVRHRLYSPESARRSGMRIALVMTPQAGSRDGNAAQVRCPAMRQQ